jgi:serine/threonine-protein kinase
MGFELLRRVRWGNVGRALGALVLVAAVVAWPRLTAPAPRVPGGDAMPLVQPGREGRGESRVRPVRRRPERRARRPERRRRRGPGRVRRRREVVVAPPAPAPAPVPPPAAPAAPAAPPVDPAQTEFGFEDG